MARKARASRSIDPNKIKTRDHAMVKIINGATKGGAHRDHRHESDKYACREDVGMVCRQCFCPEEQFIPTKYPDGFCSDSCKDQYEDELGGSREG